MRIVNQSYEIKLLADFQAYAKLIEDSGRTAYQTEGAITDDSYIPFIGKIRDRNHGAVLEHSLMTVKFITDRGVSHELVRHRLASFTQESTRYCNYSKEKFDNELTFIRPVWFTMSDIEIAKDSINQEEDCDETDCYLWVKEMQYLEKAYLRHLANGQSPQQARAVLPNSLKTSIVVSANFREWLHIFQLRGIEKAAHPQMRDLIIPLYEECRSKAPYLFDLGDPE